MTARDRSWAAGETGEHYQFTLSSDSVSCSVALPAGLWEVQVDGGNAWVKRGEASTNAIATTDGSLVTWARNGGGVFVHLPSDWATRYIAVKREGSTTVTVHLQRRG